MYCPAEENIVRAEHQKDAEAPGPQGFLARINPGTRSDLGRSRFAERAPGAQAPEAPGRGTANEAACSREMAAADLNSSHTSG